MSEEYALKELSLFTGAGGGILGTHLLGWTPIGYVEFNDYCQRVLAARIADGYIPDAPIFGDIRAFNSKIAGSYRGLVDIITAGFPCQPFSCAGKQLEADDPRNMWPATRDSIGIVRPRYCFLENVPGLLAHEYYGTILGQLAESGFDARWCVLGARHIGACHRRDRLWVGAYRSDLGSNWPGPARKWQPQFQDVVSREQHRAAVTNARGDDDAMASWLGKHWRAVGGGQVPAVARAAWELLT